jgi:hypothetical protein
MYYRIENVATQPAERITANDEERQRQGFELQTTFEWATRDYELDVRRVVAFDATGEVARVAYGAGATVTRLNKGLRRRSDKKVLGFRIDPVSGYWAKNEDEDEDTVDPSASPRQWIVPSVQDRKNALLFEPVDGSFTPTTLATVQHAILRGVEAVFQLEEGEVLAEPMPTRENRCGFLLYEATEGGAGVLNRMVAEEAILAVVARRALQIMHFAIGDEGPLPADASALHDQADLPCVAACYRCLMSYYNQPDPAGSSRVVVTLWDVNDQAAPDFMKPFYQEMREGVPPGLALRKAKLELLRSEVPAYRHPHFWAPFVSVGLF